GHLAWDLALRNPDLFAGMVVCVGGPLMNPPSANNLRYLENVAHLPIRDPWPKKVVRIAADLTETRASWIEITGMRKKVQVEAQPQVAVRRWATMNEAAKRAYIVKALAKNTARVAVQQTGKGRFRAQGFGITKFSLLLAAAQLGKGGKVEVRLANKPIRKVATPSAEVLLLDFVERFDRTRLPVARVDLP
ncbi:MAG: pimeloyl-ACP methyl ester carboxylesterase, partial [Neolewinella sp.]